MAQPKAIHQYVSALSWGDAVGNLARAWRTTFRSWGYQSEIFAGLTDERSRGNARPSAEYPGAADARTVLLIHHSFESREVPLLRRAPGRKAVVYHNVTPSHFFAGQEQWMAKACDAAREELLQLATFAERGFAFSRFSGEELTAAGFEEVGQVPFVLDWTQLDVEADPVLAGELSDGCSNLLFVGRGVPNKRVEDVLRVFTAYQRLYDPRSRLLVAGGMEPHSPYVAWLKALRAQLKPERVMWLGRVTQVQLSACYAHASAYLSMSEHEGFGVPLVEAMHRGVPVVAYGAAAVPETLGGAGLCTLTREPEEVAKLLAVLARNPEVRARLVERQRERARDFDPERTLPALRAALEPLLSQPVLQVAPPSADLPEVLIVAPLLDARPEDPLSVAARSLALSLGTNADVEILTLKAEGRPAGPGPEVQREGLVTVLKYTPEVPLLEGGAEAPHSSSLETAVRASRYPVIFFGSDQPIARELLSHVQARAFAVDAPGVEPGPEAMELGARLHALKEADLEDAVQAVAAQVLARIEEKGGFRG